jgi:hypothetical protein
MGWREYFKGQKSHAKYRETALTLLRGGCIHILALANERRKWYKMSVFKRSEANLIRKFRWNDSNLGGAVADGLWD